MAYNKTIWTGTTPINITNLQHIEDGIEGVETELQNINIELATDLTGNETTKAPSVKAVNDGLNETKGEVVFEKPGGQIGTITFSKSITGANTLKINYRNNNGFEGYLEINNPIGKKALFFSIVPFSGDSSIWCQGVVKLISATDMTNFGQYCGNGQVMGSAFNSADSMYIEKVVAIF